MLLAELGFLFTTSDGESTLTSPSAPTLPSSLCIPLLLNTYICFQSKLKGRHSVFVLFLSIPILLKLYMYMVAFTREWRPQDTNLWRLTHTNSQPPWGASHSSLCQRRQALWSWLLREQGSAGQSCRQTWLCYEPRPLGKLVTLSGPCFPHDRYHYYSYFSTYTLYII